MTSTISTFYQHVFNVNILNLTHFDNEIITIMHCDGYQTCQCISFEKWNWIFHIIRKTDTFLYKKSILHYHLLHLFSVNIVDYEHYIQNSELLLTICTQIFTCVFFIIIKMANVSCTTKHKHTQHIYLHTRDIDTKLRFQPMLTC